ncbi:MAG: c-type cytochrome, partial [Bdellovibrio sp.]
NANTEETSLSVVNGKLRATHVSTVNDYSYVEVDLPTAGKNMVIGASFGTKATEISLMVNGMVQTAELQKAGTPVDFSYLAKSLTAGGSAGQLIEYVVFGGYDQGGLSNAELNVMSRYIANNDSITNVVFDPSLIDSGTGTQNPVASNPLFLAAKAIIDNNCLGCHNNSNNGDFRNMTESKAVQMSLIVAGDPQNSPLYYRLKGSTGGPLGDSKRDMPQGGALTAAEVQAISDWITNFK